MANFKQLDPAISAEIVACIHRALDEDLGDGDVTTDSIVPVGAWMRGEIESKQTGVIAGLDVARMTYEALDARVQFKAHVEEGTVVSDQQVLASVRGPVRALLAGERTALNFLGRMSGIATLTRQFVDAVTGTDATILDTRKTAPGLRVLDKLAVQRGGGQNHRMGLYDMILIKDNHIDFAGSISHAIEQARAAERGLEIEVEARTLDEVAVALQRGVERIMLDNMSLEEMSTAVKENAGRAELEASGNISLENVRMIAETGVDYISVGALTHSAKVFDVHFVWSATGNELES
jgi:nicotinate-nucleotide pyrophosphorylase (carboxylating)